MSGRMTEPYMIHDQHKIAGELLLGRWIMFRHEWLGTECDLDTWKRALLESADQAGISIQFFDIPRKDMTLAASAAALSTFDQVAEMVSAMEYHRWTERPLGSELLVKTRRR